MIQQQFVQWIAVDVLRIYNNQIVIINTMKAKKSNLNDKFSNKSRSSDDSASLEEDIEDEMLVTKAKLGRPRIPL